MSQTIEFPVNLLLLFIFQMKKLSTEPIILLIIISFLYFLYFLLQIYHIKKTFSELLRNYCLLEKGNMIERNHVPPAVGFRVCFRVCWGSHFPLAMAPRQEKAFTITVFSLRSLLFCSN